MITSPVWTNTFVPTPAVRASSEGVVGWMLGSEGDLYYSNADHTDWFTHSVPQTSSNLVDISVSSDGALLGLCADGTVWLWSSSSTAWVPQVYDHPISSISLGDVHDLAVVDSQGHIYEQAFSTKTLLVSGPTEVTVTPGFGYVYGLNAGHPVRYSGNVVGAAWFSVGSKLFLQLHASISSSNTLQIVGVDTSYDAYSLNVSAATWSQITPPNTGDQFQSIQAGPGYIWGLLDTGDVYVGTI